MMRPDNNATEGDNKAQGFSDPESFGLFMEALRELQFYEDESARAEPSQEKLNQHLDEALESLEECYQRFRQDALPRYYLAIVLTMLNQRAYVQALAARGAEALREPAAAPTPPVGPPKPRPWPLLDRAASLLRELLEWGIDELAQSTKFNLAHVYAKRDAEGDLDRALKLLSPIPGAPERPTVPSILTRLGERVLLKGREEEETRSRAYREAVGLHFQARTLRHTIEARASLTRMRSAIEVGFYSAKDKLAQVREEIERSSALEPLVRNDLLADTWTKAGFLTYLEACAPGAEEPWEKLLERAKECLDHALQYKPNWIPAQTYLAMVYQAQGRWTEAAEELDSVLGKAETPSAATSKTAESGPANSASKNN